VNVQLISMLARDRMADLEGDAEQPLESAPQRRPEAFPLPPSDALVLADGTRLRIRRLGSQDRDGLAQLFARLSPKSRYRRYLSPKPVLTPRELAYLTDTDDLHHVALAAVDTRDGSIVGVGRYVRSSDRPCVAEVAFEVADELQSMGIGTRLAAELVQRARANGLAILTATTLWENASARALLKGRGFRSRASQGNVIELQLELDSEQMQRARPV
jgi:GNAT superfamily N-acetyltransferase